MKQSKLRKRRVVRFAILYFSLLILFVVLIVAPVIAKGFLDTNSLNLPLNLVQPTGLNNNDTTAATTGSFRAGVGFKDSDGSGTAAASSAASSAAAKRWAFNEFAY